MSRSFIALIALTLVLSCSKKQEESKNETVTDSVQTISPETPSDYSFKGKKLVEYERFLNSLDASDVTMVSQASDRFHASFYDQDQATCDSAYYLFEQFYQNVDVSINNLHYNSSTDYDSLVLDYGPNVQLSQNLLDYKDQLRSNGFYVAMSEGTTYVKQNRGFIKRFYKQLSPALASYLEQRNKEVSVGFWEDGGLTIEPEELVDRIIWWENFNRENPQFIFKKLANDLQRIYTTSLITGEDNTPLFFDEGQRLDNYFRLAYDHLFFKYYNSETAKLLKSYYASLKSRDHAEIKKFQKSYLGR